MERPRICANFDNWHICNGSCRLQLRGRETFAYLTQIGLPLKEGMDAVFFTDVVGSDGGSDQLEVDGAVVFESYPGHGWHAVLDTSTLRYVSDYLRGTARRQPLGWFTPKLSTESEVAAFSHVVAVCYECGWSRFIGYSGTDGVSRSIVRLKKAKSPCNFVEASFQCIPADMPTNELDAGYSGYVDLDIEWDSRDLERSRAAKLACQKLYEGVSCPRCKKLGRRAIELRRICGSGRIHTSSHRIPIS